MNATREHYLAELETFFTDGQICCDCSRLLEHFAIRLAALGHAAEVLAIIEQSPEAGMFAKLLDGLRTYLGRPVEKRSIEAGEIALQIHQANKEFPFDTVPALPVSEPEGEIEYGFVRASISAA